MNVINIKSLLKKKKLSGRELGILELNNMAVIFKQEDNGEIPQPLIKDMDKFQATVNKLQGEDLRVYNGYMSIHVWLNINYNIALADVLQTVAICGKLENYAEDVYLAEQLAQGFKDTIGFASVSGSKSLKELREFADKNNLKNFYLVCGEKEIPLLRLNIIKCYYSVKAYNLALKLIGKFYDIPDIIVLQMDMEQLHPSIQTVNGVFAKLREVITYCPNDAEKNKKLFLFDKLFQPIDYKSLHIQKRKITELESHFVDFEAFTATGRQAFSDFLKYGIGGERD